MRAVVRPRYGSPDVLEIQEVEKPELTDDGVLVRVRATSVNPAEWYTVAGKPSLFRLQMGLLRPKDNRLGVDFAGTVEAVGKDVTQFHQGDEVFGGRSGAWAEYVCVREAGAVAAKPAIVPFEQAGCVGVAGLTALQALRDKGRLQPGQKVLINGASGGVGTFAVQIAKALGGEVTAVCSTRNVEAARALGADHVVDYTKEDFTRSGERHDLFLDIAGTRSWADCKRVLQPNATLVMVGAPKGNPLVGPLTHIARLRVGSLWSSQKAVFLVAKFTKADIEFLGELLESGKLKPVVERCYELSEIADALRCMGEGHAQGKLVVTI